MRQVVSEIIDALIAKSEASRTITLDAIGDAVGAKAISAEEIDAIFGALENAGRSVVGPSGGDGEDNLRAVVAAARALNGTLGRKPTIGEIAEHAKLGVIEVRHALALLRVMQR